jgi:hypothetical protein
LDPANLFCTKWTYYALRAEWFVGMVAAIAVFAMHAQHHVDWVAFVLLFAYPDTLGYLPGAVAFRRSKDKRISLWYARSYNIAHSALTAAAIGGIYALVHGPNWALMAIPIHLFGDRSIFGNVMKMLHVQFEPHEPHPVFARIKDDLYRPWWEFGQAHSEASAPTVAQAAPPSEPVAAP